MFDYTIAKTNSKKAFDAVCRKIEDQFGAKGKRPALIDVDGSVIQTYVTEDGTIDVFDDYYVGAVYVKSSVELFLDCDYWGTSKDVD